MGRRKTTFLLIHMGLSPPQICVVSVAKFHAMCRLFLRLVVQSEEIPPSEPTDFTGLSKS